MNYHRLAKLKAFHTGLAHSVVMVNGKPTVRLHALTRCLVVLATYEGK